MTVLLCCLCLPGCYGPGVPAGVPARVRAGGAEPCTVAEPPLERDTTLAVEQLEQWLAAEHEQVEGHERRLAAGRRDASRAHRL